ncbi:MAG: quinol:cytochrome C oxidoreductase [Flavobacteriaceae bacterium]|nr:quinol:cytochrome C oxidoreductase [Flavobacteriaceae bacterium]
MYTFTNKLKNFSIILMVVGFFGLTYGFLTSPKTVEEATAMVADVHHGEGHNDGHSNTTNDENHEATSAHGDGHGVDHHGKHLLHQLQNKPWAALYVSAFFFMMIALGTLAFYAINRAAQAGWSPVLYRVMEGITAYLLPGAIIVFVILMLSGMHFNHLFIWMDPEVVAHDKLIQGKTGFLNTPFFLARAAFYIAGWVTYRYFSRKFSLAQDQASDVSNHKKNFRISAGFLVFYIVTESMMSWDWIMSIDPHWFSTLFGWYVFASMFVSGITTIALIAIYLKSKGYLEKVNDSHIHDLGKFMFGISIFWTYLWFSQFMLIWYSNIPEEVTYFITRIEDYNLPFFGMLVMNFIFPLLILMNSDYKRINYFIVMAGVVILLGHYIDVFNMIMPSAVGDQWFIGIAEIGAFLFFLGLFIFVVFKEISKAPLDAAGDPYIGESERFHY